MEDNAHEKTELKLKELKNQREVNDDADAE